MLAKAKIFVSKTELFEQFPQWTFELSRRRLIGHGMQTDIKNSLFPGVKRVQPAYNGVFFNDQDFFIKQRKADPACQAG